MFYLEFGRAKNRHKMTVESGNGRVGFKVLVKWASMLGSFRCGLRILYLQLKFASGKSWTPT